MELKEILKLDLLQAIDSLGTSEVIGALSESLRTTSATRHASWGSDLNKLADALDALAGKVADFEAHYGSKEP
jgi:acyl carrier protein